MTGAVPDRAAIGVVGAGIMGLALTRALDGAPVVTLEADDDPGEMVQTRQVERRVLDCGPQRTRRSGPVRERIERLDLSEQVVTAPDDLPLYI